MQEISLSIDSQNIIEGCGRKITHAAAQINKDPWTYKQAMDSPDHKSWKKAIQVELDNMAQHNVSFIVELPGGAKTIGTTWVFDEKWVPNGVYLKHKARLCAQGLTQSEGVDCNKTYAPTAAKTALRDLISVAAMTATRRMHQPPQRQD